MNNLYKITDNSISQSKIGGSKAKSLYWLKNHAYTVPDALVIGSEVFFDSLKRNALYSGIENVIQSYLSDEKKNIRACSDAMMSIISKSEFDSELQEDIVRQLKVINPDTLWAVRSSASFEDGQNKSWAGQFDSFLNVKVQDVPAHITKVWMSFFCERAIEYGSEFLLDFKEHSYGVIVQEMVNAEKSGICFSVDPASENADRLRIEATSGLGDNLVSGRVQGDSYKLNKNNGDVLSKVKKNDVLTEREIRTIYKTIVNIERHFGRPVDVEWAIEKNELYILQVRPITGNMPDPIKETAFPINDEYELTFKVSGLSFLFTDMLSDGFSYLDPFFISDEKQNFFQYFTNIKMRWAADSGLKWLSTENAVEQYFEGFKEFYEAAKKSLDSILLTKNLSSDDIKLGFAILSESLKKYSQTDNQFTDLAYTLKDQDSKIHQNIKSLSRIKDDARLWVNELVINSDSYYSQLCEKIALQFNVNELDLQGYTVNEILDLPLKVPKIDIENRSKAFAISTVSGKRRYWDSGDYLSEIKTFPSLSLSEENENLQGKVAFKSDNIVRGKAFVIQVDYGNIEEMTKNMDNMAQGDILVADFTAPELMSACKKAKAIVTDIGGLLSHAAIISRELKISCIVGLGSATKKIVTGDELVLDMTSGTVKVVS